MKRWILLALLLAPWVVGCDHANDGDFEGTLSVEPVPTATVLFDFVLARTVPSAVTTVSFNGLDVNDVSVYGPVTRLKAEQIELTGVTLSVDKFRLRYFENNFLVGEGLVDVNLNPNGTNLVSDPNFSDITVSSLAVTPQDLTLAPQASRQLTVAATLSNQEQVDGTVDSTYQSSQPAVATVSELGRVTAVAPGTTTISVTYRGVTSNTVVTVTP